MKRFVFRLQTVLDHRTTLEDKLLAELGRLRYEQQVEEARLRELEWSREKAWKALSEMTAKGADSWTLSGADEYCKSLGDDIRLQELTVAAAEKKVQQKLAEVVEASKERKLLQQLLDKQRKEHEVVAARLEQAELDDIASVRFARGTA